MLKKIQNTHSITLGADPEFFVRKNGLLVESTKVLKEMNDIYLERHKKSAWITSTYKFENLSGIYPDGIQFEMHPHAATCRQSVCGYIRHSFDYLRNYFVKAGYTIDFSGVVQLTQPELDQMSSKAKQFGCAPSKNIDPYNNGVIGVDPSKYLYRSAGGHIHFGGDRVKELSQSNPELAIALLDIFVGNTFVLLDKDPMQAERRKVYGRAGEYRIQPHGLEYRTLSNFWLRCYPIASLVLGQSRFAMQLALRIDDDENAQGKSEYTQIFKLVSRDDIVNAINNNDVALAQRNFDKIKKWMNKVAPSDSYYYAPLGTKYRTDLFEWFASKGVDYWFSNDFMHNWNKHMPGWESYSYKKLSPEYKKELKLASTAFATTQHPNPQGIINNSMVDTKILSSEEITIEA